MDVKTHHKAHQAFTKAVEEAYKDGVEDAIALMCPKYCHNLQDRVHMMHYILSILVYNGDYKGERQITL